MAEVAFEVVARDAIALPGQIEAVENLSGFAATIKSAVPVPVRQGPGTGYAVVQNLEPDGRIEIVGRSSDSVWLVIHVGEGFGWFSAMLLVSLTTSVYCPSSKRPHNELGCHDAGGVLRFFPLMIDWYIVMILRKSLILLLLALPIVLTACPSEKPSRENEIRIEVVVDDTRKHLLL